MSEEAMNERDHSDTAPGDDFDREDIAHGVRGYLVGLGLAVVLTIASFSVIHTTFIYAPAIPVALIVFAIAQMGVHLVFFLHLTTGPDSINNVMALALGILIVMLIVGGSMWIMSHLNGNMVHMQMSPAM